jgi:hypothetical protein
MNDTSDFGADRLRACLFEQNQDGLRRGVIFLARRRKIFCTPRHAQAAAWQRFEPSRKRNRRDY